MRTARYVPVIVDTGTLNNRVPHPDATTRLMAVPSVCAYYSHAPEAVNQSNTVSGICEAGP
jgi:hypothetical protein